VLLVTAISLHNVPAGLSVGVAFGGVIAGLPATSVAATVSLMAGFAVIMVLDVALG